MAWTPRTTNSGLQPGGSANQYYWTSANPGATYNLCLANCTTMAYGRVLENGQLPPVRPMGNAGTWHDNLINDWTAKPYSSYHSNIKPGDIIEWNGHVAVVEAVINGKAYCSSSLYTGDHGRAQWPVGSGIWDTRTPSIMGSTFTEMWNWFYNNNYGWRVYEYVSEDTITDVRMGIQPSYILVNPNTPGPGPGPGPGPDPGPTVAPSISINPSSVSLTMNDNEDYASATFNITITGIPSGESASGGNTYPGLTRIYNSGWSYSSYEVDGVTYRRANKTQTLEYERESDGEYNTTKYMYFSKTFSNGSISSATPINIHVLRKKGVGILFLEWDGATPFIL